jgi:hypothetical protein
MTLATRISAFLNPPQSTEVAVVEQKAGLGTGAYVMEYHEPLNRHKRDPQKFMLSAQQISRRNPWVNTAEGIITGKASTLPWHLEDENSDSLGEDNPGSPIAQAALALLERPNPQMTRSRLWAITLRHMGVCGNAFWFLDQRDRLAGTPLQIHYINPARMRPSTDKQGNLTGWILDADETYDLDYGRQTGIPLDLAEVIHFTLEPPDWGHLGHGLVEAAENLLALSGAAERYLTQTLMSGGRRGHFIGPKDGRMDDDVFDSLVKGLRHVAESPDAAKRNIVTKGPLEATPQASTPNEVGALAVLTEMREDIVSGVWRVPLSQLGVPLPAGLNSGDSRKWEEASLWQNAIEPRTKSFAETLQFHLLDRFKELGVQLDLVLDLPTFDDQQPAWELLAKAKEAPVTWNEQRAIVGLDPLPDYDGQGRPLGVRITMPQTIIEVAQAPDESGGFSTVEPEPVIEVLPPDPVLLEEGKATIRAPFADVRERLEKTRTPEIAKTVAAFLDQQRAEITERLRGRISHLLRKPTDTSWWSQKHWDAALGEVLTPALAPVAEQIGDEARSILGKPQKADAFMDLVLQFVTGRVGERITGMNETTRQGVLVAVREAVEEAVNDGLSPAAAADLLADRVSGLTVWNDARAELIARTELMNAYNDAALRSYQEYDVTRVQALDGDTDADCAARNGREYSVDDAYGIADHPNGTLDWIPVVSSRVSVRDLAA